MRTLKVDLSREVINSDSLSEELCADYIGGLGIGAKILYDEVPPGIEWNGPENRLILASGPLNGTSIAGSGSYCVVTKGSLTNGAASSQANGNFGAYLRFSGFDTVVIKGAGQRWLYLYIHDNIAELKDATHLVGKDTWETEDLIKRELEGKERDLSVCATGPAGENLVRFAAIVGDRGHVAAHNGVGAVMGSKKLKAVVAGRGKGSIAVKDRVRLSALNREMLAKAKTEPGTYHYGTSWLLAASVKFGWVAVKNLTQEISTLSPDYEKLAGEYYRSRFEMSPLPCWRCPANHRHIMKVTEGPYTNYIGKEPEYECVAGWGPLIGQTDPGAAVMLGDTVDRLGLDSNEASWLIAFVMECFEKGILTEKDTDGLAMTWGNVESVKAMLKKIARREGFGDILAEGVMRAARRIGGDALNLAVYVGKGHAPRNHDHRARWLEMFDTALSDCGTIAVGPMPMSNYRSQEEVVEVVTKKRVSSFVDSLVVCKQATLTITSDRIEHLVAMLNAVTEWNFTEVDAKKVSLRIDNLLRAFNVRHGIKPSAEVPSPRYWSTPLNGPAKGQSIRPYWHGMVDEFYKQMGWDEETGKPLPDTLRNLGLGDVINDIW